GNPEYRETATTTVASRLLKISKNDFWQLMARDVDRNVLRKIEEQAARRARDAARMAAGHHASDLMGFLLDQGMGESMNTLVIDETLCIGCDNCGRACAGTHGGISRMRRVEEAPRGGDHRTSSLGSQARRRCRASAIHASALPGVQRAAERVPLGRRCGSDLRAISIWLRPVEPDVREPPSLRGGPLSV